MNNLHKNDKDRQLERVAEMENGVMYKSVHKGTCEWSDCERTEPHSHYWGKGSPNGTVINITTGEVEKSKRSKFVRL